MIRTEIQIREREIETGYVAIQWRMPEPFPQVRLSETSSCFV
jgi:hypothetical protein